MPTTVTQLFRNFDISDIQQIKWGTTFNETKQGVYVISLSSNPDKHLDISNVPLFSKTQIALWINKLPDFLIDGLL